MRLLPLILYFLLPIPSQSGCFQRRMCCSGRNNTCRTVDNGMEDVPNQYFTPHYESKTSGGDSGEEADDDEGFNYNLVFPDVFDDENDEKIGKLILPDIIETDETHVEKVYEKYGLIEEDPSSDDQKIKSLIFGKEKDQESAPEDNLEYSESKPKHLLIRYSVLSKYMPLRITHKRKARRSRMPPLTVYSVADQECYCDEHCVVLADCCSDYPTTCPRTDCEVSDWDSWSKCTADNGKCGIGTQERLRTVVREAERGGTECPPLKEMKTCFVDCQPKKRAEDDLTTVALILNYKYNTTRASSKRNNVYWDIPNIADKVKTATYYCVHYTINWVNRNCVSVLLNKGLTENSIMCAECQPEATYHRKNGRCASDLDDGDQGFWKLIGPKSCNGIWTRINRTDHCRCQEQYPDDHPFLLV